MKIFLSYRRQDSSGYAGRLTDDLADRFGKDSIFRDVDSIGPGVDFVQAIETAVGSCDVLVAVIGRDWLNAASPSGERRLDNPQDFVRIEIMAALERQIMVVPVLVEDAKMPSRDDLPPPLSGLARYNAIELSEPGWDYSVNRLVEVLEGKGFRSRRAGWMKSKPAIGLTGLLLLAVAAVGFWPSGDELSADEKRAIPSYDRSGTRPTSANFRLPPRSSSPRAIGSPTSRWWWASEARSGASGSSRMTIQLCADKDCSRVLDEQRPVVVNYGPTVAEFDVPVIRGRTYAVRWFRPDVDSGGHHWDTFWWAGSGGDPGRKEFHTAQEMRVVVRGYNA